MGRGDDSQAQSASLRPARRLAVDSARKQLYPLVADMAAVSDPASSLAEHAVEVGPRGRGGVWIVPEVDALASMERERRYQETISEMEDELDALALLPLLLERVGQLHGPRHTLTDVATELGLGDILEEELAKRR